MPEFIEFALALEAFNLGDADDSGKLTTNLEILEAIHSALKSSEIDGLGLTNSSIPAAVYTQDLNKDGKISP